MLGGVPSPSMWADTFNPANEQAVRVDARKVLRLFEPYRAQSCVLVACIVLGSILSMLPALLTKHLIDTSIPSRNFHDATLTVVVMIAAALGAALAGVFQGQFAAVIAESVAFDLRNSVLAHLYRMPMRFFVEIRGGELVNRVSGDIDGIKTAISSTLVATVVNVSLISITVGTIFFLDWRLGILSIAMLFLMISPIKPIAQRVFAARTAARTHRDRLQSLAQETLSFSGMLLTKTFGQEQRNNEALSREGAAAMAAELRLAVIGKWFFAATNAMVLIGPAAVWFAGSYFAIQGKVTVGTIVAFASFLARLYLPFSSLAYANVQIASGLALFERVFDCLDLTPEAQGSPDTPPPGGIVPAVEFRDVSFGYRPDRETLHHVNFRLGQGQTLAIVGRSGAGKTTIASLIPKLYEVQRGSVLVGGIDVRDWELAALRRRIALVTQETFLFHDTILANLLYADSDAGIERVHEAAANANIHDYIMQLPQQYETVVGERGHRLSGGERQRLAIARAFLKNSEILILDEATSALDTANELLIQKALRKLMSTRTSIVIAHRLSTIVEADSIIVLGDGRVLESGRHEDLLKRNGVYAAAYEQQFNVEGREVVAD